MLNNYKLKNKSKLNLVLLKMHGYNLLHTILDYIYNFPDKLTYLTAVFDPENFKYVIDNWEIYDYDYNDDDECIVQDLKSNKILKVSNSC